MLKPASGAYTVQATAQPPSGGCVLKLIPCKSLPTLIIQPPSGGCVLKHAAQIFPRLALAQPPSGGCVLKLAGILTFVAARASRLQAAVC